MPPVPRHARQRSTERTLGHRPDHRQGALVLAVMLVVVGLALLTTSGMVVSAAVTPLGAATFRA